MIIELYVLWILFINKVKVVVVLRLISMELILIFLKMLYKLYLEWKVIKFVYR